MDPEPIVCANPHCRAVIGDPLELHRKPFLETETLIIKNVEGWCKACGSSFYYRLSTQQIAELVSETLKLRETHE